MNGPLKNFGKREKAIVVLSVMFFLCLGGYFFLTFSNYNTKEPIPETKVEDIQGVKKEEEPQIPHNLKLTIIKPEEDTFDAGQPRMYSALAEGNGKFADKIKCRWEFFLNEDTYENSFYKTMDVDGILAGETRELCSFTSPFIDSPGSLRVRLTMTVYDSTNVNLETIEAEKLFTVI